MLNSYPWASPTCIRDPMTEPMLFGYEQHLPKIRKQRAKARATEVVNQVIRRVLPFFGAKVKN